MAPSARSLLRELDQLPFPARQRLLARTARDHAGTTGLDDLLRELADGDRLSRRSALQMAAIVAHRECIVRSLDPGDVDLAARAISVAVRLRIADGEVRELAPRLAPELRRVLYSACRRHGATDLAERLLPGVRVRWGDHEAVALLATCRSGTVRTVLPELGYAVTSWVSLARRHPEVVLDFVETQLAALPPAVWADLWQRIGAGIAVLTATEPGRVLALLERSVPRVGIPYPLASSMAALARHDHRRVLQIVLDPRRPGAAPAGRKFWRAFAEVSDVELVALARTVSSHQLSRFLHALPPRRRGAVYDGLLGGRDLVTAGLPVTILDELPAGARVAAAERALTLPSVADDPHLRLQVTARLDWGTARPVLAQATRRPMADERAEGYALFVACARATREPDVVGSMLASLDRLPNEQDPVRSAALSALAAVPPWLFREADADGLRTLMTDALQARDSAWGTTTAVRELARGLVREGAISGRRQLVAAGLDGLALLSQHLSYVGLHGLDRDLPRGTEQLVLDAVKPRLVADAKVGRYTAALELAAGLRRRAWDLADLQRFVDQARSAKDDGVVRQAISLWLAPSVTRDARVQQVLRDDRSTITIPAVQSALARRRTDLLDDIFRRPLHGRFLKRGVRYVPTFAGCFDAWLPRQTSAYAELLVSLATAPGAPTHQRTSAVRTLGRIPSTLDDVRLFVGDAEVSVQEAALAALAWSDNPAAVIHDLLAHADSDRARVAIYAVARCARFASAEQLSRSLRPLLGARKVTSRKEAVRLLAEHRVADAHVLLGQAWSEPGQHRDVRRAIVAATRFLLDQESCWDLLTAASADPGTATAILDVLPSGIAVSHRTRFAGVIGVVASSPDPDTARAGLQTLPRWAQWAGHSGLDITAAQIMSLASTSTWRQALPAMIVSSDLLADASAITTVTTALIAALDDQLVDRDQPARQRLMELAHQLQRQLGSSATLRAAAGTVADLLAPVATDAAMELAAAALPWEDEDAVLAALLHVAQIADRPLLVTTAQRAVSASLSVVLSRLDPAGTQRAGRALIDAGTPAAAMVGLGIVQVAGRSAGWQEPWRTWLLELRRHGDADVRAAATATFMAPE